MPWLSISECERKMKNINLILTYEYELGLKLIFNIPIQFTFVDNNDDDGNNINIGKNKLYFIDILLCNVDIGDDQERKTQKFIATPYFFFFSFYQ